MGYTCTVEVNTNLVVSYSSVCVQPVSPSSSSCHSSQPPHTPGTGITLTVLCESAFCNDRTKVVYTGADMHEKSCVNLCRTIIILCSSVLSL